MGCCLFLVFALADDSSNLKLRLKITMQPVTGLWYEWRNRLTENEKDNHQSCTSGRAGIIC